MKTLLLTQLFQAQFTDTAFIVDRYGYREFAQFLLDRKLPTTAYIYATFSEGLGTLAATLICK